MADYEKMYSVLCSETSKAIDALPRTVENRAGVAILQNALYEAEDIYIRTCEAEILNLPATTGKKSTGITVMDNTKYQKIHAIVDEICDDATLDRIYDALVQLTKGQ